MTKKKKKPKGEKMTKFITTLLILLVLVSVSGCAKNTVTKAYVDNTVANISFSNRSARVTITKDVDYVQVMDNRITTSSIILVTPESPHDEGFYQYWIEPGTGWFKVYREPTNSKWTFNFFISKF